MGTLEWMKNKMAATTGFWNRRGVLTVSPALSQTNNYEESVDTEVVFDTISRLGVIHRKLKLPQLWSEVSIIKALVYKHSNQHRKEKYFQGLKKQSFSGTKNKNVINNQYNVVKCLNRLQDVVIFDKVADVKNKFPRLSKRGALITETMSNCPSIEMIIDLLGYLTGAAQLLLQVMSSCQETVQYSYAQMVFGYFVTFHLTCSSSLSRIWVLARSFLQNIAECYDIIFPWLNHLSEPHQLEKSEAKNLPPSLKTWLDAIKAGHDSKNRSLTPSTKVLTPGTLDKLFASTPRQEPEESLPRQFTSEAESWVEPSFDLGESFISDQGCRSLEKSEILTADESLILRRKLFAENSEIAKKLHKIAEDYFTVSDATQTKKRTAEFISSTEELSGTSPKKLKTGVTECSKARRGRFLCCRKIHIYSNKRWKLCIEKVRRRKLIKLRQRNATNMKDNGPKQERFATDSMKGIQNNMGQTLRRTEDKISENTAKSSQSSDSSNLPNNFSSLKQKNTKYAVRKRNGALGDDFVQRKKSSLFGNYKDTSVNSDPCRKNLESSQPKSYEETLQFEDEIDSIFNALDD